MRILMASDFYPPFIGGAERQVQLLGQELHLRGHTVGVATVWHSGQPAQQDDAGVDVRRIKGLTTRVAWFSKDPHRRFHPPFPDPGMVWGLRRLVRRWRPDLVHAHGWIAYSCAAALLGISIPLVVSVRDYGYTCALRTLLHELMHHISKTREEVKSPSESNTIHLPMDDKAYKGTRGYSKLQPLEDATRFDSIYNADSYAQLVKDLS
jgi:glycosyltransferase involved in cell wall biosynthesis